MTKVARIAALVAALCLAAAACKPRREPLPVLATLPAFEMSDQLGRSALAQLEGRVWIAGFMFTRCPSVCPVLTSRMGEVAARVGDRATLVSVSVDPEHDTPEVLARWAEERGVVAPPWLAIRGTPDATRALVRHGFLLALDDTAREDPAALLHDTRLALVDGQLRVRGYYDSNDPARLAQLVEDVDRLINE